MCGIVGTAGDLGMRDEHLMKRLLVLDTIRGQDSTGLAAVKINNESIIAKVASHPFNLFDKKSFSTALNYNYSKAFIGHNRAATSGLVKDVNAHPFQCGHITGVHNGTLEDGDKRLLEDMVGDSFNVDSEALFAAISMFGAEEVIPKIKHGKDSFKGAWSLVWWDEKEKTLNFLRNEHRPLWYNWIVGSSGKVNQIVFASEHWMLKTALEHAGGYKIHETKRQESDSVFRFRQTKPDVLYQLDLDALKKGHDGIPAPKTVELKGKEPAQTGFVYPFVESIKDKVQKNRGKRHGQDAANSGTGNGSKETTSSKQQSTQNSHTATRPSSNDNQILNLIGDSDNPYAGYLKEDEYRFLGQSAVAGVPCCTWCRNPVPFGMAGITVIFKGGALLCPGCSGNEEVSALSDYAPASRFYVTRQMMAQCK